MMALMVLEDFVVLNANRIIAVNQNLIKNINVNSVDILQHLQEV